MTNFRINRELIDYVEQRSFSSFTHHELVALAIASAAPYCDAWDKAATWYKADLLIFCHSPNNAPAP